MSSDLYGSSCARREAEAEAAKLHAAAAQTQTRSQNVAAPWAICRARGAAASPAAPSNLALLTDLLNQVDQVEHRSQVDQVEQVDRTAGKRTTSPRAHRLCLLNTLHVEVRKGCF